MLLKKIFRHLESSHRCREKSSAHPLLSLCSAAFKRGILLRHKAYAKGVLKQKRASIPIVSIGNIVAGGSGKTPLVEKLVLDCFQNEKVAILSRGYRSLLAKTGQSIAISQGAGPLYTPKECGDEPYLLASRLKNVGVFIGKDRFQTAWLAKNWGAQLALLDDGMQYRRLMRDLEIVVLNRDNLFGRGHFLPRGYLRELPERLCLSDYIVIHHVKSVADFESAVAEVSNYTSAKMIGTNVFVKSIEDALGNQYDIKDKRVALFCGIGHPQSFFKMVKGLGADVVETLIAPDHFLPQKKELELFITNSQKNGAELILCTEKDWIKLSDKIKYTKPVTFIRVDMKIVSGEKHYEDLRNDLLRLLRNR